MKVWIKVIIHLSLAGKIFFGWIKMSLKQRLGKFLEIQLLIQEEKLTLFKILWPGLFMLCKLSAVFCITILLLTLINIFDFVSRWIAAQQKSPQARTGDHSNGGDLLGCSPSFRGPEKQEFGCEHYKRNCKLRAACCGKLFACRFCHDKVSDHSMDR